MFRETGDRENFQGRYVLRHPYKGDAKCYAATEYRAELPKRLDAEAQSLATLTGWDIDDIRTKMKETGQPYEAPKPEKWWEKIWSKPGTKKG